MRKRSEHIGIRVRVPHHHCRVDGCEYGGQFLWAVLQCRDCFLRCRSAFAAHLAGQNRDLFVIGQQP